MNRMLTIFFLITSISAVAQVKLVKTTMYSKSLGEDRIVHLCIPEDATVENRCPIIIFLPGFGMTVDYFDFLQAALAELLDDNLITPMIIAVPFGNGGAYTFPMFWDSSTNGKYGTYIVQDLVDWLKLNYPVRSNSTHDRHDWIIGGFSSGGDGAVRLAYAYPELFSGTVSYSGDLAFDVWTTDLFEKLHKENPSCQFPPPASLFQDRLITYYAWSYAAAFSPDSSAEYLAQFPLDANCAIRPDVWQLWKTADPLELAQHYYAEGHDSASMDLFIRCGDPDFFYDGFDWKQFTLPFIEWLQINSIPVNFMLTTEGHGFDKEESKKMLLWASQHFTTYPSAVNNRTVYMTKSVYSVAFPNPFNASTTLSYALPQVEHVTLAIFNAVGQKVATLIDEPQDSGRHTVVWNGKNQNGQPAASGVYLYSLKAGDFIQQKKLVLLK